MSSRLPAYILAGGASSRFGSDKARAVVGGEQLILRVANGLSEATERVVVAAEAGEYADLGLTTIGDKRPGAGPLGGLEAALHHCDSPRLLLVSCDLVRTSWRWVERLDAAIGDALAAAWRTPAGWEPLFAVYDCRIESLVRQRLDAGLGSLQSLLDDAPAVGVDLPPDWPSPAQINTRADLKAVTG